MEKIQLKVIGLSAGPASNNAYALILKEVNGNRRLPIIIGAFEAQAIAIEMEGVMPPRPMTHDLMKTMINSFGANLSEVFINDLKDGTFYAKLIIDSHGVEIDARPSDAIALAVRFDVPIFVNNEILDETGLMPPQRDEADFTPEEEVDAPEKKETPQPVESDTPATKVDKLNSLLDKAVMEENYEKAAELRDEIKRILESS